MRNLMPKLYEQHEVFRIVASFAEKSKILYSMLAYNLEGNYYVINKNEKTPYFQLDWKAYSIFRCWARTFLTTGAILRKEVTTFQNPILVTDPSLKQMYENATKQRQNVYVFTKKMSLEEQSSYINSSLYNLISLEKAEKELNLKQVLAGLVQTEKFPILVECGAEVLAKENAEQFFDLIMLSRYEGDLDEGSIGNKFQINLEQFVELWTSGPQQIISGKANGKLNIIIYGRKNFKESRQ